MYSFILLIQNFTKILIILLLNLIIANNNLHADAAKEIKVGGIFDLIQRHVARRPYGNQQLTKKRAAASLPIDEWRPTQASLHRVSDHVDRLLRRIEVFRSLGPIEQEFE